MVKKALRLSLAIVVSTLMFVQVSNAVNIETYMVDIKPQVKGGKSPSMGSTITLKKNSAYNIFITKVRTRPTGWGVAGKHRGKYRYNILAYVNIITKGSYPLLWDRKEKRYCIGRRADSEERPGL